MSEHEPGHQHPESGSLPKRVNAEFDPSSGLIIEAGGGHSERYVIEKTSDDEALLHVVEGLEADQGSLFGLTKAFAFKQAEASSKGRWSIKEESPTQLKKADGGWSVEKKGRLEVTPL